MKAQINLNDYPYSGDNVKRAEIVLDGHDVADSITAFTLDVDAARGELPRLTLRLPPLETEVAGEMRVDIDQKTRDVLTRLGWTPPSGLDR